MSKDSSLNSKKKLTKPVTQSKGLLVTATNYPRIFGIILGTAGVFFGSQFLGAILFFSILALLGKTGQEATDFYSDNSYIQLGLVLMIAVITLFFLFRYLKWRRVNVREFLLLKNKLTLKNALEVVGIYIVYFVCLIVATVILGIFTGVNINQEQELGIADPTSVNDKLAVFLMLAVLPPIYEEILFRGFLFNMLRKYSKIILSVALTSVLFGVAHLEYENMNWIAAIDTLIFSGFLIYISQKHRSLYSAMLLHAIKNSIAFYVLFIH